MPIQLTELAYAAGIIDGEGYVGIKRSKAYACQQRKTPSYRARVQVRMVDKPAVELLVKLFHGHLYTEKPHCNNGRPLHCWCINDRLAEKAIISLLPYLRIKTKQANLLLELRRLQSNSKQYKTKIVGHRNFPNAYGTAGKIAVTVLSDEYIALCDELWMKCRKLNGLVRQQ